MVDAMASNDGLIQQNLEGQSQVFSILDLLPGFAYLQAPDFTIRFANRTFRDLFGEPGGRFCYQILRGTSEPCQGCPTFEVFRTRQQKEWEWKSENGRTTRYTTTCTWD